MIQEYSYVFHTIALWVCFKFYAYLHCNLFFIFVYETFRVIILVESKQVCGNNFYRLSFSYAYESLCIIYIILLGNSNIQYIYECISPFCSVFALLHYYNAYVKKNIFFVHHNIYKVSIKPFHYGLLYISSFDDMRNKFMICNIGLCGNVVVCICVCDAQLLEREVYQISYLVCGCFILTRRTFSF